MHMLDNILKLNPIFMTEEKKSLCCNANLINGIQCETCGADGTHFEEADIFFAHQAEQAKEQSRY